MTTCPGRASDATRSICRSGSPATRNSHRVPAKRYDGQRVIRFGDVALRVRVAREAVAPSPPPPTCADASSPAPTHAFKRASGMDGLKGNRSFASVRISKAHSIARNVATPRGLGVTDRADRGAPRGGAEDAPRGPFYTSKSRGGVERCQLELKGVEGGIGVHHANAVVWGPVYRTHLTARRRPRRVQRVPRELRRRYDRSVVIRFGDVAYRVVENKMK
eukprot:31478-Pelagococcus_subviridis.AAC.9